MLHVCAALIQYNPATCLFSRKATWFKKGRSPTSGHLAMKSSTILAMEVSLISRPTLSTIALAAPAARPYHTPSLEVRKHSVTRDERDIRVNGPRDGLEAPCSSV